MAKSTRSRTYSPEMFLIVGAPKDRFPMRLPRASEQQAKAWRFDFYAFRNALRHEGDRRADDAGMLKLRIEGNEVVIEHIDNSLQAQELTALVMQAIMGNSSQGAAQQSQPPEADQPVNSSTHGNDAVMDYLNRTGQ